MNLQVLFYARYATVTNSGGTNTDPKLQDDGRALKSYKQEHTGTPALGLRSYSCGLQKNALMMDLKASIDIQDTIPCKYESIG